MVPAHRVVDLPLLYQSGDAQPLQQSTEPLQGAYLYDRPTRGSKPWWAGARFLRKPVEIGLFPLFHDIVEFNFCAISGQIGFPNGTGEFRWLVFT